MSNSDLVVERRRTPEFARWVALGLLGFAITWFAWLCDDAYIVFRTVDNFVHGHGLRWNVAERVQAFTCPLWTLLSAALYFFTREAYFTNLALSISVSMAAVWLLLFRAARAVGAALIVAAVLLASRAFIDYATSGLENPLSHVLLVLFVLELTRTDGRPRMFVLSLLASLLVTNRMDHGVLVAPALVHVLWQQRSWRAVGQALLGQLPFLAWELFSIAYYGFPFPNTAYAKLYTGIPSSEFLAQGLRYFEVSARMDPATLGAMVGALVLVWLQPRWALRLASLGALLFGAYLLRVGGDFMAGRFLTAPLVFLLALAARTGAVPVVFSRTPWRVPLVMLGVIALAIGPLGNALAELVRLPSLRLPLPADPHGLADERSFYFPGMALRSYRSDKPMPYFGFRDQGDVDRVNSPNGGYGVATTVGLQGYFAGPKVHYVDRWALTDPLLARLPTRVPHLVRVGHYERQVPAGYLRTLITGTTAFPDREVAAFWGHLVLITRGPLWTRERWRTIWRMNTGDYDSLVRRDALRER